MASKPVALLLADLGVTKSHSRPRCSNDNPYSEAQFKTLKHRPESPQRFGSVEDARGFCQRFFPSTTTTTATRGSGSTPRRRPLWPRRVAPRTACAGPGRSLRAHPECFVHKAQEPPLLPVAAWINRPSGEVLSTQ